jgi:hypothetical protein
MPNKGGNTSPEPATRRGNQEADGGKEDGKAHNG